MYTSIEVVAYTVSQVNIKADCLIYYEIWDTAEQAIAREKQLKNWHREWKLNLIKELNPDLKDLLETL